MYALYDSTGKGKIEQSDFIEHSIDFFAPGLEEKLKIVFQLFDLNNDGTITPEEIWAVMAHVPLKRMVIKGEEG